MTGKNAGTSGTKEINKNYPITTGLGRTDRHQGRQINLIADESKVLDKEKIGLK